jgi:hypothetical protein
MRWVEKSIWASVWVGGLAILLHHDNEELGFFTACVACALFWVPVLYSLFAGKGGSGGGSSIGDDADASGE